MGLNLENALRFNRVRESVSDLADSLNTTFDEKIVLSSYEEGCEEDPTALMFMDIPSFTTFDHVEMKLFETAMEASDGVNFFVLPNQFIRLTFSVCDYWEQENDPYDTNVIELRKK